jgi:hypothetical protein
VLSFGKTYRWGQRSDNGRCERCEKVDTLPTVTISLLPEDEATEVAALALSEIGKTSAEKPLVVAGVMNRVVCYPDIGFAVRVSPLGTNYMVRRGYQVADLAGGEVALSPLCIYTIRGHLCGVFPLLEPAGTSAEAWVAGQELVRSLHEVAKPTFTLSGFDPVRDLAELLAGLAGTAFDSWREPLGKIAADNQQALLSLSPSEPVLLHGDLHAGQVMKTEKGYRLTDFDLACLGDPEVDWGRIYAWHNAAELSEDAFDLAVSKAGEGLRFNRVHLYGRAYALRYTTLLVGAALDSAGGQVSPRLAGFAESLELDQGVLDRFLDRTLVGRERAKE